MIKNNKFYIDDIKNVVFLGFTDKFEELIKINKGLNLKTSIITGSDQSKSIKLKFPIKIFDKIDSKFESYIKKEFNIERTLFVNIAGRWIYNKKIIEKLFKFNLVNYHGARLPLDSGSANFTWRILRNDRIDNQLVHLVNEKIDNGPIIFSQKSLFPPHCKIPADFEKYTTDKRIEFYKKFIELIVKNKNFELKFQTDYLGRYNPRLNTEQNGWIDWSLSSFNLINFINAFDDPYTGSSTMITNKKFNKVYIKKAHLHGGDSSNHPFMSGIISRHDGKWLVVSTADQNMLLIEEVLDQNKKNIISSLKVGDRFYTPNEKLEKSKSYRVYYDPSGLKK